MLSKVYIIINCTDKGANKMEYDNHTDSPMEQVIDILSSLESFELIEDIVNDVEVISFNNNESTQPPNKTLAVNINNLSELAYTEYITHEEFNALVIDRFIDALVMYSLHKTDFDTLQLRLADYRNILRRILVQKKLKDLFELKDKNLRVEKSIRFKKALLIDENLTNENSLTIRRTALERICHSLNNNNSVTSTSEEYTDSQIEDFKSFIADPGLLSFLTVPRILLTAPKNKLYNVLDTSHPLYKTYIEPLINPFSKKDYQPHYKKIKVRENLRKFNDLKIFGDCETLKDYLDILPEYRKTQNKQQRATFNKSLKKFHSKHAVNPSKNEGLFKAASRDENYKVEPSDGLLAQCFWKIHSERDIFLSLTRLENKNNITEYLDTMIRYYIFIEEELLKKTLYDFAESNERKRIIFRKEIEKIQDEIDYLGFRDNTKLNTLFDKKNH